MPDAQRYAVWRGDGASVSIERTPPGFTGTQFQDVVPDPHITYRYSVVAYYPNGTSAEAPPVQFISPPPVNPSGFTAQDRGQGQVSFQWQAVPGVTQYRLDGPGIPATGYIWSGSGTRFVRLPSALLPNIPAGPDSWRLVALYPGNYADFAAGSIASAVVRVLPPHSQPWLTKSNGAGLASQVETPAHQVLNDSPGGSPIGNLTGDLFPTYDPNYATWLSQKFNWSGSCLDCSIGLAFRPTGGNPDCLPGQNVLSTCERAGLKVWLNTTSLLWDEPGQAAKEAVYGNAGDLGVGRRTYCEQRLRGPPEPGMYTVVPGFFTVCYATAHGIPAGQPGFNDPAVITHPGEGLEPQFILAMVIVKDASGTVFMAFGKNGKYPLLPAVGLDSEGPKQVPFACLSCHGGRYNAATRKVDGASFLPLDPGLLAFASPTDQAAQEEKIRNINVMILNSDPGSAIANYIRGLYSGAPGQPGARATADYVPTGWAPQSGFYRQIVRPYCTMCHLAMTGGATTYNFSSWGNFQSYAGLIRASVCGAHTMPHNELQFKAFWTKDTGVLYVPGLLAATLGFPACT